MPLSFKYVEDHDRCSPEVDDETPCVVCKRARNPRWRGFATEEDDDVVCIHCIAAGLPDWIEQRREGQPGALTRQLRELHPDWSDEQIAADAKAKKSELLRRTPPLLSWQDWFWPACCGDYGRFLRHCGQPDLDEIASERRIASGLELLRQGLIEPRLQPAEAVWGLLPTESVTPDSNWGTQAYAFECLTCRRILIKWDAC